METGELLLMFACSLIMVLAQWVARAATVPRPKNAFGESVRTVISMFFKPKQTSNERKGPTENK